MTETRDSRDLLQRFMCGDGGNHFPVKPKEEHGRPENIELSLGLSLNGNFGFKPQMVANDNNDTNKLSRASSVTDFVNFPVDVELSLHSPLTRTCSLPAPEMEAEWRKRKDLQSLRRLEAKRKRFEKLKNVRLVKQCPPSPSPSPPAVPPKRFSSQGSIGSHGSGGSSGVSDLDSQPSIGTNRDITNETYEHSKLNKVECNRKIEPNVHRLSDQSMPCVSTKMDGPDGKRVQGFLYRYGKGEDVRIVCVCHGSFLTPAEFVKHGGGEDVDHPLRHIVVTTSLFS